MIYERYIEVACPRVQDHTDSCGTTAFRHVCMYCFKTLKENNSNTSKMREPEEWDRIRLAESVRQMAIITKWCLSDQVDLGALTVNSIADFVMYLF